MIHHLSIAARDPQHVAGVLAEFMGGVAVPFPPNPGSFFALQLDEHGSGVEVYPAGTELQPGGSDGGGFVKKPAGERGFGPTHFALSVTADADAVEAIAEREGWQCHRCNRGPFHVIEVWIENEFDGRDPAAGIRRRIPRLYQPRQGRRVDGGGAGTRLAPARGIIPGPAHSRTHDPTALVIGGRLRERAHLNSRGAVTFAICVAEGQPNNCCIRILVRDRLSMAVVLAPNRAAVT